MENSVKDKIFHTAICANTKLPDFGKGMVISMDILISVIIPIYNVKDYLERCVESVMNQTYTNLEIILVDDGSTDGCKQICDELRERDTRIRVIHKKNGGLSSARNAGIRIAKGEMLGFIDSDDYVKDDMYQEMLQYMKSDVDIVTCGTAIVYDQKCHKVPFAYCNSSEPLYFTAKEAICEMLKLDKLCFSACDKLFRKELFNQIEFPLGRVCEDLPTIFEIVKRSRNIVNIGSVKYLYYYRRNSLSKADFCLKRIDYVLFARDILLSIKSEMPELYLEAEAMYIKNIIVIIREISSCREPQQYKKIKQRLCKVLRKMLFSSMKNPYIPRKVMEEYVTMINFTRFI